MVKLNQAGPNLTSVQVLRNGLPDVIQYVDLCRSLSITGGASQSGRGRTDK